MRFTPAVGFTSLVLVGACVEPAPELASEQLALTAFCEASVTGSGVVDVETDYLPHVVACENGSADYEALKAQAVAARSYLYYALSRYGYIGDGQGSQVYTCSRLPTDVHFMAVADTAGEVLRYRDTQVAAFYVAGAHQTPPDCFGGDDHPTEVYVTYNQGKTGADVEQTILGLVDPTNYANRGCMSQNGSHCLSLAGRDHDSILRFYYGADIEHIRADGPCTAPLPTDADAGPAPPDAAPTTPDVDADVSITSEDGPSGSCSASSSESMLAILLVLVIASRRALARLRLLPRAVVVMSRAPGPRVPLGLRRRCGSDTISAQLVHRSRAADDPPISGMWMSVTTSGADIEHIRAEGPCIAPPQDPPDAGTSSADAETGSVDADTDSPPDPEDDRTGSCTFSGAGDTTWTLVLLLAGVLARRQRTSPRRRGYRHSDHPDPSRRVVVAGRWGRRSRGR